MKFLFNNLKAIAPIDQFKAFQKYYWKRIFFLLSITLPSANLIFLLSTQRTLAQSTVCQSIYNEVYAVTQAQGTPDFYAVHAPTGAAVKFTSAPSAFGISAINTAATDHVNKMVYYGDANRIYAWDAINNQHIVVASNFQSLLTTAGYTGRFVSLSSGGAAFYNGALYVAVDGTSTQDFEIFRVNLSADGRTAASVTPLGIKAKSGGVFTNSTQDDWGDFIISDTGVILALSNNRQAGQRRFWRFDLNTDTYVGASTTTENLQLAKSGDGRLWGLRSNNTVVEVSPSGSVISSPVSTNVTPYDGAECVVGSASVGDRVWADSNGDGIQDAGEVGISGVTVAIYRDIDKDGVIDATDPKLATQVTDTNGNYNFTELLPHDRANGTGRNDFIVTVESGVPTGYTATTATQKNADFASATENLNDADFGYQPSTYSISGTLYEDTDGDDNLDAGESKLPANITVNLINNSNNSVISTTTTDANGTYTFTDVADGNYKIQVDTNDSDIPSGYTLGTPNDLPVTVSGSAVTNQNFGFGQLASIGVAKKVVGTNNTEVTLDFTIENFGDVTLNSLELIDNLDNTFGAGNYSITSAPSIQIAPSQSSTVTPSTNFDGSSNTNLLDAANSELKPGEIVTIRMIVSVSDTKVGGDGNGNYINTVTASGNAPDGTTVTDNSTDSTDPDVDNFEDNSNGIENDDNGVGVNDGDNNPNNNTYPTLISFVDPNQTNTAFCSSPYGLVYSGSSNGIYAVHAKTGTVKALTTNALNTVNAAASDHINKLVYYSAGSSVYAWDSINDQHITITNNINSFPGTNNISSLSSGGAAFYNGSLYTGVDRGNSRFEVYKIDFVPGSQGRTIQSVTALGLDQYITDGDWGDMIISDDGVIYGSSRGTANFWSYDLNTNTFTDISESISGSQLAKDGEGNLWAFIDGRSRVTQIQIVGNSIQEIGTGSSIGSHSSFDAAECVIGESSIGDRIWEDTNGDGIQDSNENGIENVTVDLYWDVNGNGTIDSDEPVLATQTTDTNGNYDFLGLISDDYIVKVTDTNGVLAEKQLTTPSDTIAVNLPTGIVDYNDADFGYRSASNPNVLLIKRITAINDNNFTDYIDDPNNPYDDNDKTVPEPVNPGDPPQDTENWLLPLTDSLIGAINGGLIKPDDEIEYTIYFLSTGDDEAKNVIMCDRVPSNTTFIPTAFNTEPNKANGGLNGSDRGILWNYDGNTESLTNVNDGDSAQYFPPGVDPTTVYPTVNCGGENTNGAVVINLGNLPNATAPGTPVKSYGFVRFKGKVK